MCISTGVPSEFNEFLPKDCEEYKKWKAIQSGDAAAGDIAQLSLEGTAGQGGEDGVEKPADTKSKSSGKKKKSSTPRIIIERNTRNKKKCITTVTGLNLFGVEMKEAAKLFGKKFASGSSVTKNAEGKEQIDVQGDVLDQMAELIVKQFKQINKSDVFYMEGKKRERYFPDE